MMAYGLKKCPGADVPRSVVMEVHYPADSFPLLAMPIINKDIFHDNKNNVSKVVDENGEPEVVWQQAGSDFDVFSTENPVTKANVSETMSGFFFKRITVTTSAWRQSRCPFIVQGAILSISQAGQRRISGIGDKAMRVTGSRLYSAELLTPEQFNGK